MLAFVFVFVFVFVIDAVVQCTEVFGHCVANNNGGDVSMLLSILRWDLNEATKLHRVGDSLCSCCCLFYSVDTAGTPVLGCSKTATSRLNGEHRSARTS